MLSGSYGNSCVFVSKCHDFRPGLRRSVIKIAPLGLVLRFYISFLKPDFCNLVSEEQSTQVPGKGDSEQASNFQADWSKFEADWGINNSAFKQTIHWLSLSIQTLYSRPFSKVKMILCIFNTLYLVVVLCYEPVAKCRIDI